MKKANISLQVIFIVIILTIVMFVLIGMFVQWAGKSKAFVKRLAKTNEDGYLVREDITISDMNGATGCPKYIDAIVEKGELCYLFGSSGQMDGDLCYTVSYTNSGLCGGAISQVRNKLTSKIGATSYTDGGSIGDKTIISFNPQNRQVNII